MQTLSVSVKFSKRGGFFLGILIFLALHLHAQNKYTGDENSLLWEISGNGLKDTSYLFGTYHFAGSSFIDTLPAINSALDDANIIVGEVKIGSEVLAAAQLIPHMKMANTTLDQLLSPGEYKMVNSYLSRVSSGLTLNMLNTSKPAAVQLVIMQQTAPVKPRRGEKLMDLYFQQQGERSNKEIIGLETITEQGRLIFNLPLKRQKNRLVKFVKEAEKQEMLAAKIFEYYRSQNLASLELLFEKYNHYNNEEIKTLLKIRNKKWMEKLPEIMKRDSAFIAVGGGHLIGKYGLISLLKRSGYTVRPLDTHGI